MAVQTVDYSMKVPKEGKELCDALASVVSHFKAKKSIAEAASLLPNVMSAVDGVSNVVDEIKSDYNDELVAYMVHTMWTALKAK
jgi:hypothetical protein